METLSWYQNLLFLKPQLHFLSNGLLVYVRKQVTKEEIKYLHHSNHPANDMSTISLHI